MLGLDLGLAQIEGRVFRLNQEKVLILQDRVNIRTKHKHVYPYSTHTKVLICLEEVCVCPNLKHTE